MSYGAADSRYGRGGLPPEGSADWESEGWAAIVDSMLHGGSTQDMGASTLLGAPAWGPLNETGPLFALPSGQQPPLKQPPLKHQGQHQGYQQEQPYDGFLGGADAENCANPFDTRRLSDQRTLPSLCCSDPKPRKRQLRVRCTERGKRRRKRRGASDSEDSDWRPQRSPSADSASAGSPSSPSATACADASQTRRKYKQQRHGEECSASLSSFSLVASLPHPQQHPNVLQCPISPYSSSMAPSCPSSSSSAAAARGEELRLENAALNDYDMCEISVEWHLPELPETAERQKGLVPIRRVFGINAGMTLFNLHRIICISLGLDEERMSSLNHVWILPNNTTYGGGPLTKCRSSGGVGGSSTGNRLKVTTDRAAEYRHSISCFLDEEERVIPRPESVLIYVLGCVQMQVQILSVLRNKTKQNALIWVPRCVAAGSYGTAPGSDINWNSPDEVSQHVPTLEIDVKTINLGFIETRFSKNTSISRRTKMIRAEGMDNCVLECYSESIHDFWRDSARVRQLAIRVSRQTSHGRRCLDAPSKPKQLLMHSHNQQRQQEQQEEQQQLMQLPHPSERQLVLHPQQQQRLLQEQRESVQSAVDEGLFAHVGASGEGDAQQLLLAPYGSADGGLPLDFGSGGPPGAPEEYAATAQPLPQEAYGHTSEPLPLQASASVGARHGLRGVRPLGNSLANPPTGGAPLEAASGASCSRAAVRDIPLTPPKQSSASSNKSDSTGSNSSDNSESSTVQGASKGPALEEAQLMKQFQLSGAATPALMRALEQLQMHPWAAAVVAAGAATATPEQYSQHGTLVAPLGGSAAAHAK
ncbi:hypothetical protein cyc_04838 [Cyclospora cayetanensis]|uniref:Uncharacterized protein n=1 Tax=Cyclospora cayetanensis TaxID=88456 RepID=A0A1D3D4I6_9EIME|nr:hypothetical protein cyc_04838 [Cyclospora cayetanensis]